MYCKSVKILSALTAAVLVIGSGAFIAGAKQDAESITARRYNDIVIDGEKDEAWQYAEKADIKAKVGETGITAELRVLYGDHGINHVTAKTDPNKVLYLLIEVDKHGSEVTDDDTVYVSVDLVRSGKSANLTTDFGVGIVGVTPIGEAMNFGWYADFRSGEFYSASKKTADDKWMAEIAIDIIDASLTTRPYQHIENGNTVAGFGIGTEIGLSVIACENGATLFAENETVAWGSSAKRDFIIPANRVVIGNDVTEVAFSPRKCGNTAGDVNSDGKIKGNDATLLLKKLADWNVTIDTMRSDCNGDGKIKGSDVTLLLKKLADWNVELVREKTLGNVIIFGDSISTFEGWIPEGYPAYYPLNLVEIYNVTDVEQTWWQMLLSETDSHLVRNESFSGSCISYRSYGQAYNKETSFLYRFDRLVGEGYFDENHVDTVIIFGGTNDWAAEVPTGNVKFNGITEADLETVLPATSAMLSHIREALPEAEIILIVNDRFTGQLAGQYARIGKHYGAEIIQLHNIDHYGLHPDEWGMYQIRSAVMEHFGWYDNEED